MGISFSLDITTTPSPLRLADSAITDISPTDCPKRFVTETRTDGLCGLIADGLIRLTITGTGF